MTGLAIAQERMRRHRRGAMRRKELEAIGLGVRGGIPGAGQRQLPASAPAFSPASVSGIALWLEANVASFTLNGSSVSQWREMGGRSITCDRVAAVEQPTWLPAENAVRFDGLNDSLALSVAINPGNEVSVYCRMSVASTSNSFANVLHGGNRQIYHNTNHVLRGLEAFNGGSFWLNAAAPQMPLNVWATARWRYSQTAGNCTFGGRVDSAAEVTNTLAGQGASSNWLNFGATGGGNPINGKIKSLIIVKASVSPADDAALLAYLAALP